MVEIDDDDLLNKLPYPSHWQEDRAEISVDRCKVSGAALEREAIKDRIQELGLRLPELYRSKITAIFWIAVEIG